MRRVNFTLNEDIEYDERTEEFLDRLYYGAMSFLLGAMGFMALIVNLPIK